MAKEINRGYDKYRIKYNGVIYLINGDGTATVSRHYEHDIESYVKIEREVRDELGRVCRVKKVGESAFSSCNNLKIVEISEGIEEIEDWAMSSDSLETVKLPKSLKEIKHAAFYESNSLSSIVIPDSVTKIGDSAFYGCKALRDIILPESLISIGSDAFKGCGVSNTLYISSSVTEIGDRAFDNCDALRGIVVDPENAYYHSDGESMSEMLIESHTDRVLWKVKSSAPDASYETEWTPNDTEKTFMDGKDVKGFTSIDPFTYFLGHDYTAAIVKFSADVKVPKHLTIPSQLDDGDSRVYRITELYGSMFFCEKRLEEADIAEGIEVIGDNIFSQCENLKRVALPSSLRKLGARAFTGCKNLSEINTDIKIEKIEKDTFFGCDKLVRFAVPDCVETIGESAFGLCKGLISVTLPYSLRKIEKMAFVHCDNLTSIYIPSAVREISGDAFNGCNSLESITVDPENSKFYSSGNCIIEKYTEILRVGCQQSIIPEGVVEIGDRAFCGRMQLNAIELPSGTIRIGDGAFSDCYGLKEIYIPDSVTEIGEGAFYNCYGVRLRCQAKSRPQGWSKYMGVRDDAIEYGCRRRPISPQAENKESFLRKLLRFFKGNG